MDVCRQKYNSKTWGCFSESDVENPTVLKKKKTTTTSPPIAGKRGGVREKKVREGDRGEEETPRNANEERERGGKEKSEGGCNKTNLDVCASCRCGHCEYCGRKGTAWGKPLFFCCFFLVISYAAAPPSPASLSVNHRLF